MVLISPTEELALTKDTLLYLGIPSAPAAGSGSFDRTGTKRGRWWSALLYCCYPPSQRSRDNKEEVFRPCSCRNRHQPSLTPASYSLTRPPFKYSHSLTPAFFLSLRLSFTCSLPLPLPLFCTHILHSVISRSRSFLRLALPPCLLCFASKRPDEIESAESARPAHISHSVLVRFETGQIESAFGRGADKRGTGRERIGRQVVRPPERSID